MASLRVPPKHYNGFENFLRLPDKEFENVINCIQSTEPKLDIQDVINKCFSEFDELYKNQASAISDAILSLSFASAISDSPVQNFVTELIDAIDETPALADLWKELDKDKTKVRLEKLFSIPSLAVSSKARSIMYEYENVYYKSRVITDIRPIFDGDVNQIDAALIIHSLRIHYHIGDDHKDFFVALDTSDLQQLIDVLERAKTKAENLKKLLQTTGTPTFESVQK